MYPFSAAKVLLLWVALAPFDGFLDHELQSFAIHHDFGGEKKLDREWKGLEFLDSASDVKSAWVKFWPQSGNVPNWDAVGA
jgi:hypothetical protein